MNAIEILAECRRRGIALTPDGGTLHYKAPKGVITEELKSALRDNKLAILALLGAEKHSDTSERDEKREGLNPGVRHPPRNSQELVWLIDYLSDPKAFAAWFEELMQRADPAERSE